jgi:hypothetical protein
MASFTERMIGAARLDVGIYEEVEADTTATGQAMAVVVLASVAAGIGAVGAGFLSGVVLGTVAALIGWFIWALLTYFIGTKLLPEPQTKSDMGELLRTIGFASSPGILRILGAIPLIGWVIALAVSIWMLVAMVIAVRQALDYQSTGRTVLVCLIGWLIFMIVGAILGLAGLGAMPQLGA